MESTINRKFRFYYWRRSQLIFRGFFGFLFLCLFAAYTPVHASEKRGLAVGRNVLSPVERIASLNAAWYYHWGTKPFAGTSAEFIPMVWGGKQKFRANIETLNKTGPHKYVLGFNEPDHRKQANISVDRALFLWGDVVNTGKMVGSPAAVNSLDPWMRQFMAGAKERKLRVDFIAVHWYGPPNPEAFISYIDRVYEEYKKPIWITEFAVADWDWRASGGNRYSNRQVVCFLKNVLPALEKRDYVQRYAWFAGKLTEASYPSMLIFENGDLTEAGRVYANYDLAIVDAKAPAPETCRGKPRA